MKLTSHIRELQAAIFRSEDEMQRMRNALGLDMCPCCVGAAYGGTIGPYCKLERKRERQEAWLRVLTAKVNNWVTPGGGQRFSELRLASEAYAELVARHRRIDITVR